MHYLYTPFATNHDYQANLLAQRNPIGFPHKETRVYGYARGRGQENNR